MSDFSNARALRVIGQDLETRGLKTFDIRFVGGRYKASCGYQTPPAPTPVTLEYTMDDIDELEGQGQSRRSENPVQLDLLTLSQLLRSLGGYLDSKSISLSRLTNNESAAAEA